MHKHIAAALIVLSLAAPAVAGNTSSVYTGNGAYSGRIVTQPGSNTSNVYNAQGGYMGRIVTQPDGSRQAYDGQGGYLGRSQPSPSQDGQQGQQEGE